MASPDTARLSRKRPTALQGSLAAGILLAGALTAHAQTYSTNIVAPTSVPISTFNADTTPNTTPTFDESFLGGGTAVPYNQEPFVAPAAATYDIRTTVTSGYSNAADFVQLLYAPAFVPATPTVNFVDFFQPTGGVIDYQIDLTAAQPVTFVDDGIFNTDRGKATTVISQVNPGSQMLIPDASQTGTGGPDTPGTITQTLNVTDSRAITSFNSVTVVGLDHPYLGDLVISLSHNGVTTFLIDRVGYNATQGYSQGSAAAFVGSNTYTFSLAGLDLTAAANAAVASGGQYANTFPVAGGTYAAQPKSGPDDLNSLTTLSSFVGQNVSGAWTLSVSDDAYTDTGSFLGFSFNINNATAAPEPSQLAAFGVGLLGLGALALRARRAKKQDAAA